jgi:hypothetical protein
MATDSGSPSQSLTRDLAITVQDAFDPPHPWQNPEDPLNVNDKRDAEGRHVIGIDDALLLVADLRNNLALTGQIVHDLRSPQHLSVTPFRPPFVDPSGDDRVTLADLLLVIAFLRQQIQGQAATSEAEADRTFVVVLDPGPVAGYSATAPCPQVRKFPKHDDKQPACQVATVEGEFLAIHGGRSIRGRHARLSGEEFPGHADLGEVIDSFVSETARGWALDSALGLPRESIQLRNNR